MTLDIPERIGHVPENQSSTHSSHTAIFNTGGSMPWHWTLANVPLASAHGRCTVAALSPELHSVEGSLQFSCTARWHVTLKYLLHSLLYTLIVDWLISRVAIFLHILQFLFSFLLQKCQQWITWYIPVEIPGWDRGGELWRGLFWDRWRPVTVTPSPFGGNGQLCFTRFLRCDHPLHGIWLRWHHFWKVSECFVLHVR